MEIFLTLFYSVAMLIVVCFIGSLILAKDTKEFHIHFSFTKGVDISGSFFDRNKTQED